MCASYVVIGRHARTSSSPTPTVDSCLRVITDHTIVNPLAASRAAKTAASTLEDVTRVKKGKYADDAKNMGARLFLYL